MATLEIEPQGSLEASTTEENDQSQFDRSIHGGEVAVAQTVEMQDAESPAASQFELFRTNLHVNVMSMEAGGVSALGFISAVMADLRAHRSLLNGETIRLDYALLASNHGDRELMTQLLGVQAELLENYHMLKWAEGYRRDRLHLL